MSDRRIGVAVMGRTAPDILERIKDLEQRGVEAAWLTTGGAGLDALTIFSAAAPQTDRILMGTCIVPTWPRHPIEAVQQVQVIAQLAPGRFRLGLGPSHKPMIEQAFGFDFQRPLTNLREYVHIVKALLREGKVDFDGFHYHAHIGIAEPVPDVPIMASALQRGSYVFCGEETDGAISWVSPYPYLRDVALPAMREGAAKAGRDVPPLIAHLPVCVHDDPAEVREASRRQLSVYPRLPFYAQMFKDAGFPEAGEQQGWSDAMIETVVLSGDEGRVGDRLREVFDWGVGEVIAHIVTAGADAGASWRRTASLLAEATAKGV